MSYDEREELGALGALGAINAERSTQPILDEIRDSGIVHGAIAHNAIPLSFRYPKGHIDGYGLDLLDEIA